VALMAGPILILPGAAELELLRALGDGHMRLFLTDLDECGWNIARDRLKHFATLPEYRHLRPEEQPQPQTDDPEDP
jgi:hypothetical protein